MTPSKPCPHCAQIRSVSNISRHIAAMHLAPTVDAATAFWRQVDRLDAAECWEWTGTRMVSGGYGSFAHAGVTVRAHRYSWELANSTTIPSGLQVLHSCDNPPCVNPNHLRVGTLAENMRDVAERGRQKGERNPAHKLSQEQVDAIKHDHSQGVSNVSQARRYGVDASTISLIVNAKRWAR